MQDRNPTPPLTPGTFLILAMLCGTVLGVVWMLTR